ncbi:MAG: 5-methylcytosine-specific restriction endonuclease McrA [Hyphomicrobiaceae bacterium]|jgi:5-methylcytosine-specific restriction endonuclease McrA
MLERVYTYPSTRRESPTKNPCYARCMDNSQQALSDLSEQNLLAHFARVIAEGRRNTVQLLVAISEIDERKLWAKHACSSMFVFCMQRYHMSESMTAKRIWAARVARRFPVVLDMIERGQLHLTAVQLLAKHLTEVNHREVLARAKHKSAREIESLIAEIAPRPDVPSRVRALPIMNCDRARASTNSEPQVESPMTTQLGEVTRAVPGPNSPSPPLPDAGMRASAARGRVTPLAPRRFKVEITVDQQTYDKLRALEDLLSRQAAGDPAVIISRAIDVLLAETLKKKAALTDRPRKARSGVTKTSRSDTTKEPQSGSPKAHRTRAIPAALRRAVWLRDVGRCGFEDDKGHRCRATRILEYHHKVPFAQGGQHELANIELRCHGHNQYQADLDFGRSFMRAKRGESYQHSARTVGRR